MGINSQQLSLVLFIISLQSLSYQ